MDPIKIDVSIVARDLKLAPQNVEAALALLDAGNTIPFVTRFRKDQTGGLNENQLLAVKQKAATLRALSERKATILRAIESQNGLTDEIRVQIEKTTSSRRLEDLYLPFKTKKQSKAAVARQQGLLPLAEEILESKTTDSDLATRATEFVRVDKGLNSVDEVIKGVGDLIAEKLAESEALRASMRKLFRDTAKISSRLIKVEPATTEATDAKPEEKSQSAEAQPTATDSASAPATPTAEAPEAEASTKTAAEVEQTETAPEPAAPEPAADTPAPTDATSEVTAPTADATETSTDSATDTPATPVADVASTTETTATTQSMPAADTAAAPAKKKKKKKKKKKQVDPFKDYHEFDQLISKLPNHRVLAINRGERSGKLKVKLTVDQAKVAELVKEHSVPDGHPSAEFLEKCANEMLSRSLLPSIEREIRRELTEQAERHAVEVFANNLRNLLLQPPTRNRVVLAIDPGYKRGCSVALIDGCGNLIESGQVFVVGNQTRKDDSKKRIRDWVKAQSVDVIAIGNGAACREVEQMVSDAIAEYLQDNKVQYAIINGAGASVYSTSEVGRNELPDETPAVRSAISIGRRLQDPLSELVKIAPANIGVGLYQHDIKAKHLSESLDEVVRFCVNQVGVDINTASPALLKYVSGFNSLTAMRAVEHRTANGRFNNREELKTISGVGDATFVQAAGFLRIHGGDSPLDATGIHPESYPVANDILQKVEASVEEIFPRWLMQPATAEIRAKEIAEAAKLAASMPKKPAPEFGAIAQPEAVDETTKPAEETTKPVEATEQAASDSASDTTPQPEAQTPPTDQTPEVANTPATEPQATEAVETTPAPPASAPDTAADSNPPADRRQFDQRRKVIVKSMSELDLNEIASAHSTGSLAVKDIIMTLKRPAWDPRDKVQKPIFRRGILKVDDLKPEMQLEGQVVNVVDFGVFVDIGLGESSLVHVSQLSNHYIADPHKVFAVGDAMKVWVTEVSTQQRRVRLTAIRPGTKKSNARGRSNRGRSKDQANRGPAKSSADSSSSSTERTSQGSGRRPGKYDGGRGGQTRRRDNPKFKRDTRRSKPKPVKPITDKMLKGDEPMRSFSDLAQFVKRKPDDKDDTGKKK